MTDDEFPSDITLEQAAEILESEYMSEDEDRAYVNTEAADLAEGVFKSFAMEQVLDTGDHEFGWSIELLTLHRINNEIKSVIEDMRGKENWKNQIRLMLSDELVLFFTLADEIVAGVGGQILENSITDENRGGESSLKTMTELNHYDQVDLLYYSGKIDEGLKSELTNIHKLRNNVVHNLHDRHFLSSIDNLESRIDRAINAISELFDILDEGVGLS